MSFEHKYLKYKQKYLELKAELSNLQTGGNEFNFDSDSDDFNVEKLTETPTLQKGGFFNFKKDDSPEEFDEVVALETENSILNHINEISTAPEKPSSDDLDTAVADAQDAVDNAIADASVAVDATGDVAAADVAARLYRHRPRHRRRSRRRCGRHADVVAGLEEGGAEGVLQVGHTLEGCELAGRRREVLQTRHAPPPRHHEGLGHGVGQRRRRGQGAFGVGAVAVQAGTVACVARVLVVAPEAAGVPGSRQVKGFPQTSTLASISAPIGSLCLVS